jgi:hypothetical protein
VNSEQPPQKNRSHRSSGRTASGWAFGLLKIAAGGVLGIAVGSAILWFGFGKDPLGIVAWVNGTDTTSSRSASASPTTAQPVRGPNDRDNHSSNDQQAPGDDQHQEAGRGERADEDVQSEKKPASESEPDSLVVAEDTDPVTDRQLGGLEQPVADDEPSSTSTDFGDNSYEKEARETTDDNSAPASSITLGDKADGEVNEPGPVSAVGPVGRPGRSGHLGSRLQLCQRLRRIRMRRNRFCLSTPE